MALPWPGLLDCRGRAQSRSALPRLRPAPCALRLPSPPAAHTRARPHPRQRTREQGKATVIVSGKEVATLAAGQFFGERALLKVLPPLPRPRARSLACGWMSTTHLMLPLADRPLALPRHLSLLTAHAPPLRTPWRLLLLLAARAGVGDHRRGGRARLLHVRQGHVRKGARAAAGDSRQGGRAPRQDEQAQRQERAKVRLAARPD